MKSQLNQPVLKNKQVNFQDFKLKLQVLCHTVFHFFLNHIYITFASKLSRYTACQSK